MQSYVRISHFNLICALQLDENASEEITGNPSARMEWKFYFRNVVHRYSVEVDGWPVHLVRFQNLSEVSSPYDSLKTLLNNWSSGKTYWRELSEDELEERVRERDEQIANGKVQGPAQRCPRSDRGKKRKDPRERQASEDEDVARDSSLDDSGGDQPPRKRAKHTAAHSAQGRMGRNVARKAPAANEDDSAEAEADNDADDSSDNDDYHDD